MTYIAKQTPASIASGNHQFTPVMERYNLDFCDKLISFSGNTGKQESSFTKMNAEELVSYIVINYHIYLKQSVPTITAHLDYVATRHGYRFPYMRKVYDMFVTLSRDMTQQMENEETILFPMIKEVEKLYKSGRSAEMLPGYIQLPVRAVEADHEEARDIMYQIRTVTNNYTSPQYTSTTFDITLSELKEFEEELRKYADFENYILFPKAIQYESELFKRTFEKRRTFTYAS